MSKMRFFAIYDEKSQCYRFPFFHPTTGMAMRTFAEGANDPRSEICKFPEDFRLYQLGNWDESTGLIMACEPPILCATARDVKKPDPRPDLFPEPNKSDAE